MRRFGEAWMPIRRGQAAARHAGFVLAAELRAHGVDLSYAPVLDLDYGVSSVIGDRAFHRDPQVATELARAVIAGLATPAWARWASTFPATGRWRPIPHVAIPVDGRSFDAVWAEDMQPFRLLAGGWRRDARPRDLRRSTRGRRAFRPSGCRRCCAVGWVLAA